MVSKGRKAKFEVVRDELNWIQTSIATAFLPIYILIVIGKLLFNVLIGPPRHPSRMIGMIRILAMFGILFYEAGFIFEKHENLLMHGLQHLGMSASKSEISSALIYLAMVGNIIFQFIYVVVLGASTQGSGESYTGEGGLPGTSDNGIGRMMRGLDYDLSMKNSREGQKEVMRDWFGGKK